uniref:Uncharacterized protein n=1 Tax=Lepeophtheirus salmonis TaxID=72036 RepID=A0A0K2UJL9_LEPSM
MNAFRNSSTEKSSWRVAVEDVLNINLNLSSV